ncbi:hypothetical protein N8I77_011754 [Diaporthe amygdali]|uniref:Meiotic expression up-regulated protein 6 PH domain-containing protein n=1 Tax=Phomopsis amygdali TaxID=1214568 RepID=A0AAD9VXH4_PHOAM|nr:immunogenic [Diaporthe amygdali]KAJ0122410.1 immunogenic [Diaporthe amygdali]KAK2598334.1 hypothetical protein N8I77_011754 [Diaporthe amygdali]
MAEEQKPVAVPTEETPATTTESTTAAAETTAPVEAAKEETAPAATEAAKEPATETPAADAAAAPAAEEVKKEAEPVEDGQLEHKGSNFPKNFIYSKKFFWFGSEAVDPKKVPALLKDHHLAAWASETGKGLLFFSEKGQDKSAPSSAIALHDAAEPTTEGPNKFVLSSKGHKHTFKAGSTAERDNWVSQIKLRIGEAKELAKTVTESEQYKATLASFSPAVKKEEKKEEKAEDKKAEETPKAAEETPAAEGAAEPAATTEAAAATTETTEGEAKEEAKEEAAEAKKDERKRSTSKKRASIFGALLGGNKDKKESAKAEDKKEEAVAEAPEGTEETPAAATETPATTEPATEAAKETETAAATEPAAEETKAKAAEKPTPTKRTSLFGGLSFGKKKPEEAAPATPAKDTPPVSEDAPVIPKVDTVEPLSTEVSSPANVPTETTETAAAVPAVNGEKKEVKADKRKSSFPFALGKKNTSTPTSPAAVEEGAASPDAEKAKSPNPFSKFRATIKNKGKAVEKPAEKTEDKPAEGAVEEPAKPAEEAKAAEEVKPEPVAEEASEPAKDAPVASTPVVTASA